ncbi:IS701 family transposase [Actinomadura gamaensis]|uniref:IS701 family transposase n=1 Tax=Actinomadura gamaensis TaxID=1763541 RepID=A0ABV9TU49_9ACTN
MEFSPPGENAGESAGGSPGERARDGAPGGVPDRGSAESARILRTELFLRRLHRMIGPRFARAEPRERAFAFLRGMVASGGRRNGRRLAEAAGEDRPDGMQRLLTTARWDADELRDDLRDVVLEHLADEAAVLVVHEEAFEKKGSSSVGVGPRHVAAAGAVRNCQTAVFLTYAVPRAQAIIDRELFLPPAWARDPLRRARAGVPVEIPFRTRTQLGWEMVRRALDASVPFAWVAAASPFGHDVEFRRRLAARGVPYVLGLRPPGRPSGRASGRSSGRSFGRASGGADAPGPRPEAWTERGVPEEVIAAIPARDWLRVRDPGDPLRPDGVCHTARVLLRPAGRAGFAQWLLVRRDLRRTLTYLCAGPAGTTLRQLAEVARQAERGALYAASARADVGLDHYEVRLWTAWYRHITLALLAHASLVLAGEPASPRPGRPPLPPRTPPTVHRDRQPTQE